MKRESCGSCGSSDLVAGLDLGTSPLADLFVRDQREAIDLTRYPIGLTRCQTCTLVQLTEIVPDAELWAGDYGFYSSASSVVVEHSKAYADWLLKQFPRLMRERPTLEIACNDGVLMSELHYRRTDVRHVVGIDPASGPVKMAREANLDVWQAMFDMQTAESLATAYGRFGVIVANNVLAHVTSVRGFLGAAAAILDPTGYAVLEVQYLGDLLAGNQFDHVYHEHRSFFSLTALARAVEAAGLRVLDVAQNSAQGGTLRVTCGLTGYPSHAVRALRRQEENWVEHSLDGLQQRAERVRVRVRAMLEQAADQGKRVAGYGASAKSTTLLNFAGIGPEWVQYFVDTTPTKWGRFTPGTGIPIISPEADSRAPDIYLLTVWNYAAAIMARERSRFSGQWLIPIPAPVLL